MFDSEFVAHVKALLEIEGGACACLLNLDRAVEGGGSDRSFFIDRDTAADAYGTLLRGAHPGDGWVHDIERFSGSSIASEITRSLSWACSKTRRSIDIGRFCCSSKQFLSSLQ
jgi:hypothetical protein